jgi:hypothetical protein
MADDPQEYKAFTGDFRTLVSEAIELLIDGIRAEKDTETELRLGCGAFDQLTPNQKLWSLHRVSKSLLCTGIIHDDRRLVCLLNRVSGRGGKFCKFVNFTSWVTCRNHKPRTISQ